ncbi:MAG: hypothetical protein Q4F13_06875 [Pseudomonadota bacterium]|nr:hypothetical protein [Pseudomonadota bacterium]
MTPGNFLAAEPLIVQRLQAVLPPQVHVLTAAELAQVAGSQQPTPAVHVLYRGYQVDDSRTGAFAGVEQSWLTVAVARNVADIEQGYHARQAAGPLAAQVMDALYRHRLRDAQGQPIGMGPLRLDAAPAPGFEDGHFYLPLGWLCPVSFRSDACPAP